MTAADVQTQLDVRQIATRERHPLVFGGFSGLRPGGSLLLVHDHDPIPLFYQFHAESPGQCTWDYLGTGAYVARAHWQGGHRPARRRRKAGHAARC